MKPSYIFLINIYILVRVNCSLIINNFIILAHQLKYNLGLYPSFNLKGDIFIDSYSSIIYIKFIISNNSNQLS